MNKIVWIALFTGIFCYSSSAADEIPLFGIFEHKFTHAGAYDNPYRSVTADVIFYRPDGRTWKIPMFWDGDNNWKVRISPDQPGA